ncbi:hypothetical protein [Methanosarcina barkeri]|uniref:hypothetical protein n=1 Tax=Methanosarcina barkeri TaxID=2208 RepID=UPI00064F7DE7|nr:hypothetical protein [Methanosarcina barkeri]
MKIPGQKEMMFINSLRNRETSQIDKKQPAVTPQNKVKVRHIQEEIKNRKQINFKRKKLV